MNSNLIPCLVLGDVNVGWIKFMLRGEVGASSQRKSVVLEGAGSLLTEPFTSLLDRGVSPFGLFRGCVRNSVLAARPNSLITSE